MVPPGSVLVSSRAKIGLVAIAGTEMCTSLGFNTLVPSPLVDSKYLYHCMKAFSSRFAVLENGASLKVISKSTVEDFEIPLPELEMQKHIANILDKLDSLCRKRTKATHLANELLAAGHEVEIISTAFNLLEEQMILSGPRLKFTIVRSTKNTKVRALTLWKSDRKLLVTAIKKSDADIFHAHWTYELSLIHI